MFCSNCGSSNHADATFCHQCGSSLEIRCIACSFRNAAGARFCNQCGSALNVGTAEAPDSTGVAEGEDRDAGRSAAERRQLTVMFTDLVGSTGMSERLDPEDLRTILRDYRESCSRVIQRFEGHLAQYMGDGLLVYFGYPQAHEDDAQRAVQAGLGIIQAIGRLNARNRDRHVALQVRIGIHTGLVVAGEMGTRDHLDPMAIVGHTPNVAARIQAEAMPNTVVISSETLRLLSGFFEFRSLGPHTLKGVSQPVEIYQVLCESTTRSRMDAAISKGLTRFIGRADELAELGAIWKRVTKGIGQVVCLSGEPGIGKSRLLHELMSDITGSKQGGVIVIRCSPYHRTSAFFPIIDLLDRYVLACDRETSSDARLTRIEALLAEHGQPLQEMVPLFASLLSVPYSDRYSPPQLTPERQKRRTMEALVQILLQRANSQPVLLVVEDLHWADPSTLELLRIIYDLVPGFRLMMVVAFRNDFEPAWAPGPHVTRIALNRLTPDDSRQMVGDVIDGMVLPQEVLDHIVTKTDGIPLFVEELTKTLLESGQLRSAGNRLELERPLQTLAVPATLHDSLMARLDRLASAKPLAQLGATLGRQFSYELLRAVSRIPESILQVELMQLVASELIFQKGVPPDATYTFKHALIQDAAQHSLLKSTRAQYHHRIAETIESEFPEIVESQPELVAEHYSEAGDVTKALAYWLAAGQRALRQSANIEAVAHITRGLELIESINDRSDHRGTELELRMILGPAVLATKGYAPELEAIYTRAVELSSSIGGSPHLGPALFGLWSFYVGWGRYAQAMDVALRLLELAEQTADGFAQIQGYYSVGYTEFCQGNLMGANTSFERVLALYDSQRDLSNIFLYGYDTIVLSGVFGAWTAFSLGYPETAARRVEYALDIAMHGIHPFSLTIALNLRGNVFQFRGEPEGAREWAEKAIALAHEQGFPLWAGSAYILLGWSLAFGPDPQRGAEQAREGITTYKATTGSLGLPYLLTLTADACRRAGSTADGILYLDEAVSVIETTGERWWEAEVHRTRGELLLSGNHDPAEAERSFIRALDVARSQHARMLELRAATSLVRMLQGTDREPEALETLASIVSWFTAEFDNRDLLDARALLGLPSDPVGVPHVSRITGNVSSGEAR